MPHLPSESQARKELPITSGVVDYFPDALVEVAHVSYVGNQQHNPGQPLHWAREKSSDHADCITRHLLDRGTRDSDGLRHSAKLAWRALALLQLEIENDALATLSSDSLVSPIRSYTLTYDAANPPTYNDIPLEYVPSLVNLPDDLLVFAPVPERAYVTLDNATSPPQNAQEEAFVFSEVQRPDSFEPDASAGVSLDTWVTRNGYVARVTSDYAARVHPDVIAQVVRGLTVNPEGRGIVYVSGPMRNIPHYNFPAFDAAREDIWEAGFCVISPADIDRASGIFEETGDAALPSALEFVSRDVGALMLLHGKGGYIAMLPGWEHSTGAVAELMVARWLGVPIMDFETGLPLDPEDVDYAGLYKSIYNHLAEGNIEAYTNSQMENVG